MSRAVSHVCVVQYPKTTVWIKLSAPRDSDADLSSLMPVECEVLPKPKAAPYARRVPMLQLSARIHTVAPVPCVQAANLDYRV